MLDVMREKMIFTDTDISIFAKLIQANDISVAGAINWAYSQHTDDGAEPWIEELAIAHDKEEVLSILRNSFSVSEHLSNQVIAGKVAFEYFQKKVGLHEAISRILFDIFIDTELGEEKTNLYIAEDFFGWHQQPEIEALKIAKPILIKYATIYEHSHNKFSA